MCGRTHNTFNVQPSLLIRWNASSYLTNGLFIPEANHSTTTHPGKHCMLSQIDCSVLHLRRLSNHLPTFLSIFTSPCSKWRHLSTHALYVLCGHVLSETRSSALQSPVLQHWSYLCLHRGTTANTNHFNYVQRLSNEEEWIEHVLDEVYMILKLLKSTSLKKVCDTLFLLLHDLYFLYCIYMIIKLILTRTSK